MGLRTSSSLTLLKVKSSFRTSVLKLSDRKMGSVAPTAAPTPVETESYKPRYIDIGINLADPIFRGVYYGKQRHPDDLQAVVSRAREVGCTKMIVTGSDFTSSRHALEIAKQYPGAVYTTAGIHPCSSSIFSTSLAQQEIDGHIMPCDPDPEKPVSEGYKPDLEKTEEIMSELKTLIEDARNSSPNALVAFGEFGLDYDRLHYCSKRIQLHSFAAQLGLAASLKPQLPLFLHSRAAHQDFVRLLKATFGERLEKLERGGVVHSFTGTPEEMKELMDLGLYIGTNGCSFKTVENCAVVKEIHLDRLMLETDGPWCEVRPSHEGWKYLVGASPTSESTEAVPPPNKSSKKPQKKGSEVPELFKTVKKEKWVEGAMVKGRNEPCMIERVGKIVAGIKGVTLEEVCETAWRNTVQVFGLDEDRN